MYAVIETGGKQYRVAAGDTLEVEQLSGEPGGTVTLDRVLWLSGDSPKAGNPTVENVSVVAEVVEQLRGPKKVAFKKRRRKGYHRTVGHRQQLTRIKISEIKA